MQKIYKLKGRLQQLVQVKLDSNTTIQSIDRHIDNQYDNEILKSIDCVIVWKYGICLFVIIYLSVACYKYVLC